MQSYEEILKQVQEQFPDLTPEQHQKIAQLEVQIDQSADAQATVDLFSLRSDYTAMFDFKPEDVIADALVKRYTPENHGWKEVKWERREVDPSQLKGAVEVPLGPIHRWFFVLVKP